MTIQKRNIDDMTRLLAVIICMIPVMTFCSLYIMSFTFAKIGLVPPPLTEVKDGLRDIVLMIVGGAAGLAFGTYSSANSQKAAAKHEEQIVLTQTTKEN